MSGVVSKKLKFKGDKPKKKKRSHKDEEGEGGGADEMAALAAADPRGVSLFASDSVFPLSSPKAAQNWHWR